MGDDKKEKKEKKEKKDKGDREEGKSKEKKEKKEKKDKGDRDGDVKEKKEKKDKGDKDKKKDDKSRPQSAKPRPPPKLKVEKKSGDSYLADMDDFMPTDSDEEDEADAAARAAAAHEDAGKQEEGSMRTRISAKEEKKIRDKERKQMEDAARMKAEALRDDDLAFDVAFEAPTDTEAAAEARDIKVRNITVRVKGKCLLDKTELSIVNGRRYVLVGPNGKGKSTLLRLMAKRQIPVPSYIDVLLVEQEIVGDDRTAIQAVVEANQELVELRAIEKELTGLSLAEQDDRHEEMTKVYDRMREIGADAAESTAAKILRGLGFTEVMQKRTTQSFSGGWRMRISLARALFIQPTLLLLDEPTNHLDLRAVLWLEEYLQRWKKTLIVVSHDRDFLNTVATDVIHLHDERLQYYRGNFAQFEEMYEQRRREMNKAFDKYEKQLKAAKSSGMKNAQAKAKDKAQAEMKPKKDRGQGKKRGMMMDEEDNDPDAGAPRKWNDYNVVFEFPEPTELAPPLLQLIDADFKYPGRDDFGMSNLNLGIDMGSRVAIVGPNGAGKSTLMNLLMGDISPTSGEQRRSMKLRVGRYSQHFVDVLTMDDTPVSYLMSKFPTPGMKPEMMRAKLGKFGLAGHNHLQPIVKLSGGQKARVVFAAISLSEPHILLLDEPTNHLDMQSIDALGDAIEEFEGGVVIISHDARLLQRVCDDVERSEVWIVEDGKVRNYDGDFNDYKEELIKEIQDEQDED